MASQSPILVSSELYQKILDLRKDKEEGDLTIRGYVNKLRNLLQPSIFESKEFCDLEKELEDEELTEKGFYKQCAKILDSFNFDIDGNGEEDQNIEKMSPNSVELASNSDKENDQNIENGCVGIEADGNEEMALPETEGLMESIKQMAVEEENESSENKTLITEEEETTVLNKKPGKATPKRSSKKSVHTQPLISSAFSKVSKVTQDVDMNSCSVDEDDSSPENKRKKLDDNKKTEVNDQMVDVKPSPPVSRRCHICCQLLSFEDLKLYTGHPDGAVEEFVALTDPKLSLFTGEEDAIHDYDQRPQHKITGFSIYDKEGHLCPFDGGLIERNVFLFFSGYLKPIYEENPSVEDGIAAKDIGPINEWWISGFDGGENALLGFSTAYAEYILMEPSESYVSFFEAVQEKIYMSKLVIELLLNSVEPSYEDLLLKVQTAVPPQGIPSFTEDSLLRHAQFICDQVHNFDQGADEGEESLISSSCMQSLMTLAGVILDKKSKPRHRGGRIKIERKMPKFTKATTTPLVRNCFESFFADQIANEGSDQGPRRVRCGVCETCQEPDCGSCKACRDMVKFGGSGRSKQCCVNRKCPNMTMFENAGSDGEEEVDDLKIDSFISNKKSQKINFSKKKSRPIEWVGESITKEGKRVYYSAFSIDGEVFHKGDCVMVEPDDPKVPVYIARITSLWQVNGRNDKMFHADWFCRGNDTILGETADTHELFLIDDCEDTLLDAVLRKVTVIEDLPHPDWKQLGGIEDPDLHYPIKDKNDHTFFYQKWYHPEFGRFEDPPKVISDKEENAFKTCQSCLRIKKAESREMCLLGAKQSLVEGTLNQYEYEDIEFLDYKFEIGDCAYVDTGAFKFKIKSTPPVISEEKRKNVDEQMYPEFYRKTSDRVKGSNVNTPEPFRVVRILKILCKDSEFSLIHPDEVRLKVAKFYRPENTHRGISASYQADLNLLYWSDEETTITLSSVMGRCGVVFKDNLQTNVDEFFQLGPNRFVFLQAYDPETKQFVDPPQSAQMMGGIGKGKGKGKGKAKEKSNKKEVKLETYPTVSQKLQSLDVFAGCGGLSEGLHQSGVADSRWAIEVFEPAAQAFRLNNPNAVVFTDDCNHLLKLAMEDTEKNEKGQKIPKKGEVDLLCGGPPCQGFSGMNRFNSRQYSQFKNSLVASYLSFCDFYRPKYFILENVRNFVSYKCSMVLKLTLRVLLKMGYQCSIGILQAGCYGVSQTRRRAIVFAAAPGEKLPLYPEPLTAFSPRACQLSLAVEGKRYTSNCRWVSSAPHRTITVRDSMSDLPEIKNGARKDQINYGSEPEAHYQRLIRGVQDQPILRDHICKDMAALVEARMRNIPTAPGSDWRDLPNISVRLGDGKFSKTLVYTHHDKKNGRSSTGALRGVCSCVSGKTCDPMDKQFNTLIPWCLPHTGNRHNHWSGLYGRLEWDGYFSTTVTNPEPMGKQGRVLHPEQNRVVSVRECARSQGFPDTYRFYGSILEKHRQVGNAVPPPMAKAIGLELKKAICENEGQKTEDTK